MSSELETIWGAVLEKIRADIGDPQMFDYFFRGTRIKEVRGDTMTVVCTTHLSLTLFSGQFAPTIEQAVAQVTGTNYKMEYTSKEGQESPVESSKKTVQKPTLFKNARLSPNFTFDTFVTGQSDFEALQAASYVAANPGKGFNPLLIYGDSGLGKTHLLQAIGNSILKNRPGTKVLCISANDFVEEFVSYVTGHHSDQLFSAYFREEVDVLLLDDIQFLKSKEKTMETFFNVFQVLVNDNKQIVLTSDQDPRLLDGLSSRLKTRFSMGLPVKITKPDFETARNILLSKIQFTELRNCIVDDEALDLIAGQFGDNVRELEGALNRLLFCTILSGPCKHITAATAREALGDLRSSKQELSTPSVNRIVGVVADFYSLTPAQIMGKTRVAQIALARHIAMYLCKNLLGMNYSEIGKAFGKDHTSAMSGIQKVEKLRETDPLARQSIDKLKERFRP